MSELAPQIRELFARLDHAGDLGQSAASGIVGGEAGREALGTRVRFTLRIGEDRLLQVRYRAYGCPHTLATCEWLARTLEGRRLDALAVTWHEVEPSNDLRDLARRLLRVHRLRAGDAIQLAAATLAAERRPATLTFVTLDERLEATAGKEGFSVVRPA